MELKIRNQVPSLLYISNLHKFIITVSIFSLTILLSSRKVSVTVSKLPFLVPILALVKMVNILCFVQGLDLILKTVLRVLMEPKLKEGNFQGFFLR